MGAFAGGKNRVPWVTEYRGQGETFLFTSDYFAYFESFVQYVLFLKTNSLVCLNVYIA